VPNISVTRSRVRSLPFLPQIVVYSLLSARQARHTAGFLGGKLVGDAHRTFWTITAWENESAMRSIRGSLAGCDNASPYLVADVTGTGHALANSPSRLCHIAGRISATNWRI